MNTHSSPRLRNVLRAAVISGLSLIASAATFKPAQRVLDINSVPTPVSSYPGLVCDAPGFTLLVSEQSYEPYKLWRTDGTQAGTVEIAQFPTNIASSSFVCLYAEGPGPVYFQYIDDFGTPQLWRSDGTAAGTFRLLQQPDGASEIRLLGVQQGQAVFVAMIDDAAGMELIHSNGTVAGTQLLREFTPGPDWSSFGAHGVTLNGQLLFGANGSLWGTDGTAAGTHVILNLPPNPGYAGAEDVVLLGNRVLFSRVNDAGDSELWVSDGTTAGSSSLALFSIQPGTPRITALTAVSSSRAVFGVPSASGPVYMPLWRTDGTVAGTQPLLPSQPDLDFNDDQIRKVAGGAIFMGITAATGRELWFTDGTDTGTYLLRDHVPGPGQPSIYNFNPAPGGYLYLSSSPYQDLWYTDGTVSGTWSVGASNAQLAQDWIYAPPVSAGSDFLLWSYPSSAQGPGYRRTLWRGSTTNRALTRVQDFTPTDLGPVYALRSGRMLFSFDTNPYGMEPWISDGTVAGTHLLRDLEPQRENGSSDPTFGFNIAGNALFAANDGTQGPGLWRSDGTAAGTQRLAAGAPVANTFGLPFAQLGSAVIYAGTNSVGVPELWRTDGTVAGTSLLRDLSATPVFSSQPMGSNPGNCGAGFLTVGSNVFYGAAPLGVGKLFRTDGTTAGTIELGSFPSTLHISFPQSQVCVLALHEGSVYFSAVDPVTEDPVLWRSNGQVGGNQQVQTAGGTSLWAPSQMAEMNGALYFFTSIQGQTGLWRLTAADPVARMVVPRTWSADNSIPSIAAVLGNVLLFRDYDVVNGSAVVSRMYRSDGTAAGTYLLSTTGGTSPFQPHHGARIGNRFMYAGVADATGIDLWLTDGTTAGTSSIRIPVFGDQSGPYPEFVNFNGLTYFAINHEVTGESLTEIWRTDGTLAGTERVNQVPRMARYLAGAHLAVSGHRLLFAGSSETEGAELWNIENEAPVAQADSASAVSPDAVSIDVLANDTDPDGSLRRTSLRVSAAATHGSVAVDASNGNLRYTPAAGFVGTDMFQYVVADTQGREAAAAIVTVTVAAVPNGGGGGGSGGGGGGATGWLELLVLASLLGATRARGRCACPYKEGGIGCVR